MDNLIYPAIFIEEDEGYSVIFPDLKGCVTQGYTIEEAYNNAREALALYLDDMKDKPTATAVKEVRADKGQLVMSIEVDDKDDIERFDALFSD